MRARKGGTRTDRHADVVALGAPDLAVPAEARGLLEDLVAELLIAQIEAQAARQGEAQG